MDITATQDRAELRDYFRPIWDRRWIVLAVVALVTALTYVWYARKPKEYTATASVFITSSSVEQSVLGQVVLPSDDRNVANQATLIESPSVAAQAGRILHFGGDARALLAGVSASPRLNSDFVDVRATNRVPSRAAAIANAFATGYITVRTTAFQSRVREQLRIAQRELAAATDSATRQQLQQQVHQLQVYSTVPTDTAEVSDRALTPSTPSAPKPVRNALFAFVLSCLLAIMAAYGLDRLDRRLKILDDVERAFQRPILATIPHSNRPAPFRDGAVTLGDSLKESFRSLRTNLRLAAIDRPVRKLLVTSALPGEGKSTIVRNLAIAYCELGLHVAVIEADLRNPSLSKLFEVERSPGVTDVLMGAISREEAFHLVRAHVPGAAIARLQASVLTARDANAVTTVVEAKENGRSVAVADADSISTLGVLPAGLQPPNPPAVLAGEAMHAMIDEVASEYDLLIIDSAPLLAVSDTIPLLSLVDGTIVVSRLGVTTSTAARRLLDLIDRVPQADVLGVAVNDVTDEAFPGGYSYYGYYGYGRPA